MAGESDSRSRSLTKGPPPPARGGAGTGERNRAKGRERAKRILLVKDNVAFRLPFARMLELELAPELDVAFAQADSLAETHALLREEDGLDLVRELEEATGGGVEPLPRLVITADPEHSVAAQAIAQAMEEDASGPAFRGGEDVRSRGRSLD